MIEKKPLTKKSKMQLIAKQKTLLTKFIVGKYVSYEEPERKGTAKGKPIGFSLTKYLASLHCALTNRKHADIAEELKISHGLIRKWSASEQFKGIAQQHIKEFIQTFIEFLNRRISVNYEIEEDLMKKTHQELSVLDFSSYRLEVQKKFNVDHERLPDVNIYSYSLIQLIQDHLEAKLKTLQPKPISIAPCVEADFIISVIGHYRGCDTNENVKKKSALIETLVRNRVVDIILDIVSKPKMSSEERKQVCVALKYLKQPESISRRAIY